MTDTVESESRELSCTFELFKRMASEFHAAAPSLDQKQLDNAWKCLALGFLNMEDTMWEVSATTILKMEMRRYLECDMNLSLGGPRESTGCATAL